MTTPRPISDGALWTRADFPETRSWVQPLSPGMSAELKTAVAKAMAAGIKAITDLGPETGALRIGAGNYGGNLGPHHFHLKDLLP